jgi:hypothetical protein
VLESPGPSGSVMPVIARDPTPGRIEKTGGLEGRDPFYDLIASGHGIAAKNFWSEHSFNRSPNAEPQALVATAIHQKDRDSIGREDLFIPRFFIRDLRETIQYVVEGYHTRCAELGFNGRAKGALTASLALGLGAALVVAPVLTAGVGALAIWQVGVRFESNRHSRMASVVAASIWSMHMGARGFYEFTLCASAGIARSIVQSMLPDNRPAERSFVALAGFFATALVYASTTTIGSLLSLEHLPLIGLGLGAIGGAFNERFSWGTRLTQVCGCCVSLIYHSMVTQSALGLVGTLIFMPAVIKSIYQYDLSKMRSRGQGLLTLSEKI